MYKTYVSTLLPFYYTKLSLFLHPFHPCFPPPDLQELSWTEVLFQDGAKCLIASLLVLVVADVANILVTDTAHFALFAPLALVVPAFITDKVIALVFWKSWAHRTDVL